VSGPRQSGKGGFVLPRFIASAMSNEPLTVFGDGTAKRAFTHVRDIANGCYLAMKNESSGQVYNLGNPNNITTISEFASRVISVTQSQSKIELVDPKTLFGPLYEEASDKFPDASLTIKDLGWEPKKNLDEIISETWEFMKKLDNSNFQNISGR
jgi:UDP-glucose 4-epimerase